MKSSIFDTSQLKWPNLNTDHGLGLGWEAYAWVELIKYIHNVSTPSIYVLEKIYKLLLKTLNSKTSYQVGQSYGIGGAASVALLANKIDARFSNLSESLIKKWQHSKTRIQENDFTTGHTGAVIALSQLMDQHEGWRPPKSFLLECSSNIKNSVKFLLKSNQPIYLGYSHGLASLILAFNVLEYRFGVRTGDYRFQLLEILKKWKIPYKGKSILWPATTSPKSIIMNSWCHGSPGIALALHSSYILSGKKEYKELYDGANAAMLSIPNQVNNFCCGRAGIAHIFLEINKQQNYFIKPGKNLLPESARGHGFLKGQLSIKYLHLRIQNPQLPMPFSPFG